MFITVEDIIYILSDYIDLKKKRKEKENYLFLLQKIKQYKLSILTMCMKITIHLFIL